jgi:hypothetical protein
MAEILNANDELTIPCLANPKPDKSMEKDSTRLAAGATWTSGPTPLRCRAEPFFSLPGHSNPEQQEIVDRRYSFDAPLQGIKSRKCHKSSEIKAGFLLSISSD